jgi:hypothetical protein
LATNCGGIAANKGKVGTVLEEFYAAGYTKENVVDLVMAIGIITLPTVHNVTDGQLTFQ